MNRALSASVYLLIVAAAATSCSGGVTLPEAATPEDATAEPVTLPPAWTATPSPTPVPFTPTASSTSHPAILAARQTATRWPTLYFVAVGAGANAEGWTRIDFETGSVLLPDTYEEIEPRRFDDDVEGSMLALGAALAGMLPATPTPGLGTATSLPPSIDGLAAAHSLDFMQASDRQAQVDVWLVGAPVPDGIDLETLMTLAAGSLQGEVEVVGREIVGGAPRNTGRAFVSLIDRARGTVEDRVIYVIVEGERAWTISYRAPDFDRFEAMLPVFETSALSLEPAS